MLNTITNQSHRLNQDEYFEWWYFHFVAKQPIRFNFVLHKTDIFGIDRVPYISTSLFFTNRRPSIQYFRRALAPCETIKQDGGAYLGVAGNLFNEDKNRVNFQVHINNLQISGHIKKFGPPVAIENGVLFEDEDAQTRNWWVVQIPQGEFKAKLTLGRTESHLSGFAYLDHQWGTAQIQNCFRDWIWGCFASRKETIIFYRIRTANGIIINRGILASRTHTLTTTRLNTPALDIISTFEEPEKIDTDFWVTFPEHDCKLRFHLSESNLMRRRISESHTDFITTYCRWNAFGEKDNLTRMETLGGIVEYLRIRKPKGG